ncbi:serine/threonine-protein kinase M1 [Gonapodya sp. JEL0774]|nr:serine/threonine-protein kinase M1 [Gonapodya sp. JEL0774]
MSDTSRPAEDPFMLLAEAVQYIKALLSEPTSNGYEKLIRENIKNYRALIYEIVKRNLIGEDSRDSHTALALLKSIFQLAPELLVHPAPFNFRQTAEVNIEDGRVASVAATFSQIAVHSDNEPVLPSPPFRVVVISAITQYLETTRTPTDRAIAEDLIKDCIFATSDDVGVFYSIYEDLVQLLVDLHTKLAKMSDDTCTLWQVPMWRLEELNFHSNLVGSPETVTAWKNASTGVFTLVIASRHAAFRLMTSLLGILADTAFRGNISIIDPHLTRRLIHVIAMVFSYPNDFVGTADDSNSTFGAFVVAGLNILEQIVALSAIPSHTVLIPDILSSVIHLVNTSCAKDDIVSQSVIQCLKVVVARAHSPHTNVQEILFPAGAALASGTGFERIPEEIATELLTMYSSYVMEGWIPTDRECRGLLGLLGRPVFVEQLIDLLGCAVVSRDTNVDSQELWMYGRQPRLPASANDSAAFASRFNGKRVRSSEGSVVSSDLTFERLAKRQKTIEGDANAHVIQISENPQDREVIDIDAMEEDRVVPRDIPQGASEGDLARPRSEHLSPKNRSKLLEKLEEETRILVMRNTDGLELAEYFTRAISAVQVITVLAARYGSQENVTEAYEMLASVLHRLIREVFEFGKRLPLNGDAADSMVSELNSWMALFVKAAPRIATALSKSPFNFMDGSVSEQVEQQLFALLAIPFTTEENDTAIVPDSQNDPLLATLLGILTTRSFLADHSPASLKSTLHVLSEILRGNAAGCFSVLANLPAKWATNSKWRQNFLIRGLEGVYGDEVKMEVWRALPSVAWMVDQDDINDFVQALDPVLRNKPSAADITEVLLAASESLGRFVCAIASRIHLKRLRQSVVTEREGGGVCIFCDRKLASLGNALPDSRNVTAFTFAEPSLLHLFLCSSVTEHHVKTAFATVSLPRLLRHANILGMYETTSSDWQQWVNLVVGAMNSPERKLRRLVALHSLPVIMEQYNVRLDVTARLTDILQKGDMSVQSSIIQAVGSLARASVDFSSLEGYLSCLIIQFSGPNAFVKGCAFNEIRGIAAAHNRSVAELCNMFLSSIAVQLIEQLHSNRAFVQEVVVVLFARNLRDFVVDTLEHTLPVLVSKRNTSVLEELSRLVELELPMMLIDKTGDILHYIFMSSGELDGSINFFVDLAKKQDAYEIDIRSLLTTCLDVLAPKLGIELGAESALVQEKALRSMRLIAEIQQGDGRGAEFPKSSDPELAPFVHAHFLLLLSTFNDKLINSEQFYSEATQRKVVKALIELLKIGGSNIYMIAPQLMSTLRTALSVVCLLDVALHAWHVFIKTLEISKIGSLLSQIVAILTGPYDRFSETQLAELTEIFKYLFIDNELQLRESFADLPALPNHPIFEQFSAILSTYKVESEPIQTIRRVLKSVAHESALVAQQAVSELELLLNDHQLWFQSLVVAESVDDVVNSVIKSLMSALRRFGGGNDTIQEACCRCLGIIGVADPSRLDVNFSEEIDVIRSNFTDAEEMLDFVCKMIEMQLVPAFRSPRSTKMQRHFAYSIQELLRLCGFTPDVLVVDESRDKMGVARVNPLKRRWERFSESCIEAIQPLLVARYLVHDTAVQPVSYPLFGKVATFSEWLQAWTRDLVEYKVDPNSRAAQIFRVCKGVINQHDESISLFILPHLVLNVLLGGNDQKQNDRQRNEILSEVLAVLEESSRPGLRDSNATWDYKRQRASQIVFALVDYLSKWVRLKRQQVSKSRSANTRKSGKATTGDDPDNDEQVRTIDRILSMIPQDMMAIVSYRCNSFERSLLHLERHIRNQRSRKKAYDLTGLYELCQRVYAKMDEADGMEGISTMFPAPSLEQQTLEHESTGNWSAAQSCYELIIQENPDKLEYQVGLINCLRNLGHFESMLTHVGGILSQHTEWSEQLESFRVEAAWKLSKWDTLEGLVDSNTKTSFEISLGRSILAIRGMDSKGLQAELKSMRRSIAGPLVLSSLESYDRAQDHVLKLHMLYEVEEWAKLWELCEETTEDDLLRGLNGIVKQWDSRLLITNSSHRVVEPVLSLRRTMLDISHAKAAKLHWHNIAENLRAENGRAWLQSAKVARKAGYLSTAYSNILHAASLNAQSMFFERSKLLWVKGEHHRAIVALQNALGHNDPGFVEVPIASQATSLGSMGAGATPRVNLLDPSSEKFLQLKSKLLLARWLDETHTGQMSDILNIFKVAIRDAGRMLTLWLTFGLDHGLRDDASTVDDREKNFLVALKAVQKWVTVCPSYQVLENIILSVLEVYPQQALWQLMPVAKSNNKQRTRRVDDIFSKAKRGRGSIGQPLDTLIEEFKKLTHELLNLCNHSVQPRETVLSINSDFRQLQRLTPTNIIVPLQALLTVALPSNGQAAASHKPFPEEQPTIMRFHDEVEIMSSLQRPRKITITGSDGRDYIFLCKPKDDLRKDARLMEFNWMINKLLKKDAESRKRRLYIRTYSVVPLNEECGLIEWVNNTTGLRQILNKYYKAKGLGTSNVEIKEVFTKIDKYEKDEKRAEYVKLFETLLDKFPPVFHEWHLDMFPEPRAWFAARSAYTRTTAVISMVGYVLGLGDRHGENILFDETRGDCVHVDFNCLFERHDKYGENENEYAVKSIQAIKYKLEGIIHTGATAASISVEGQVQDLINQAMSVDHLARMYIGWAPSAFTTPTSTVSPTNMGDVIAGRAPVLHGQSAFTLDLTGAFASSMLGGFGNGTLKRGQADAARSHLLPLGTFKLTDEALAQIESGSSSPLMEMFFEEHPGRHERNELFIGGDRFEVSSTSENQRAELYLGLPDSKPPKDVVSSYNLLGVENPFLTNVGALKHKFHVKARIEVVGDKMKQEAAAIETGRKTLQVLDEKDEVSMRRQQGHGASKKSKSRKHDREATRIPSELSNPPASGSRDSLGVPKSAPVSGRTSPIPSGASTPSMLWFTNDLRERIIHILAVKPLSLEELARAVNISRDRMSFALPQLATLSQSKHELLPALYKELRIFEWPKYDGREREAVLTRARNAFETLRLPPSAPEWGRLVDPKLQHPVVDRMRPPLPEPGLAPKLPHHQRSTSQPPQSRSEPKAHGLSTDEDTGMASDGDRKRKGGGGTGEKSNMVKSSSKDLRKKTAEANSKKAPQESSNPIAGQLSVYSTIANGIAHNGGSSEKSEKLEHKSNASSPAIGGVKSHKRESSHDEQQQQSSGKRKRSPTGSAPEDSSENSSDLDMEYILGTLLPIRTVDDFARASTQFTRIRQRYQKVRRKLEIAQSNYRARRMELAAAMVEPTTSSKENGPDLPPEMQIALDRKLAREFEEQVPLMKVFFGTCAKLHQGLLTLKIAIQQVAGTVDDAMDMRT